MQGQGCGAGGGGNPDHNSRTPWRWFSWKYAPIVMARAEQVNLSQKKCSQLKKLDFPRKGLFLYLQGVHQDVQVEEAS